jgi:hypothetical protein
MKLSMINEIQLKYCDTNMNRTSTTQVYGVSSINDLYHYHYKTRKLSGVRVKKPPIKTPKST